MKKSHWKLTAVFMATLAFSVACNRNVLEAQGTRTSALVAPANADSRHHDEKKNQPVIELRHVEPRLKLSDQEWKERLTPAQYKVLRQESTEPAWSGALLHTKEEGIYRCAGCNEALFTSNTKYDSGTGWPSFWAPISDDVLGAKVDNKLRSQRTEVHCANCGGHLGHVFNDGPKPTGKRYCLNSVSLEFEATTLADEGPRK